MLFLQGERGDPARPGPLVMSVDLSEGGSFDAAWRAWAEGHAAASGHSPPEPGDRPLHLYDVLPPDVLRRLDWVTLQCAAITKILPGNRCDSDLVLRFAATYREPGLRRVLDDMRRHPPG
ncbi:hypothetical protein GCM10009799_35250 [Nocardiopsis rhodophaea]|uniref:Uncharacterized protein n=1 Tax=Nocardiopsis rhodophaea TaxID=280238 RepID=A0ABP5EUY1_9ACTN